MELPKEMQKVKFRVTWEPADTPVRIKTYLDGGFVDHGTKHGGSWGMDGIGKSSAYLQADAAFKPRSLHCQIQVGWRSFDGYNEGNSWSCDAHWGTGGDGRALGPLKPVS